MLDGKLQNYIDWTVGAVMLLPERNNYAYRVTLKYQDGRKVQQQKSGFKTKKEAEAAKQRTIGELCSGIYAVYTDVKVADFLEYWLEGDIRNRAGSHNTYASFRNAVHKHIIPFMGKKKMADVSKGDVRRLYNDRAAFSVSIAKMVKTVMNISFDYAVGMKIVPVNPAAGVELPKRIAKAAYHTRSIDGQKTLTMEQIQILLEASKETPIHMMVLFNVLMGLRRQEILGLKYSDIDYINRTISIERQLGRAVNTKKEDFAPKTFTKQEIKLKTSSSRRELPIPDYVFEAIMEERKQYEKRRSRRKKEFQDLDYICCSSYGRPRSKDFHWKHYKKLLKDTGLPDIRWHDLRSIFCTLLLKNDFSPKAVSKLMGHSKEIISVDVYGDNANIIPDEIPELVEFMDEVLPKETEGKDDKLLDIVTDTSYYIT